MQYKYIITWEASTPQGYDFNEDDIFDSAEDAEKYIKGFEAFDKTKYSVKRVPEVFFYLSEYIKDLDFFTDNEEDLEKVYDFFENVRDEYLRKAYIAEAVSSDFYTFDRQKWLDRRISYLQGLKN